MTPILADDPTRARAATDLEANFTVEAGAGTGKTSLLVSRILTILISGRAGLDQIVAITFTEKAAGELKIRLREEIERRRADCDRPREERDRLQLALEDLERAHVSTIHAFCAGLLREYPLAAGVDPAFTVLEELGATLLRHRVWEDWLAAEMDTNAETVSAALASGVNLAQLRQAGFQWLEHRDLVELVPAPRAADVARFLDELDQRVDRLLAERVRCRDERDAAWLAVGELERHRERLRRLPAAEATTYLLRDLRVRAKVGNRQRWDPPAALETVRSILREVEVDHRALRAAIGHNGACAIAAWLRGFLDRYAAIKRAAGTLDFTDLLVITRDVLRRDRELRRQVQRRYRYLLVDEFQDTDPLQAEIVFLLAEASPRTDDWSAVALAPGKLFLVGDPKQSIYRFRRADLAVYEAAKAAVARQGEVALLQTNFRSSAPLVGWINQRFQPLLEQPDEGLRYVELFAGPESASPAEHAVVWLPLASSPPAASAEDLRRIEARTVAAFLRQLVGSDAWRCRGSAGAGRRLQFGDVAILFRRHDSMRAYQDELRELDVPHRVVGGRRLFRRQEMLELHALLAAVANPNDEVAVVATLRSLFCGVSDEDLLLFRRSGGQFDYTVPIPPQAPAADHFRSAFTWMAGLRQRSREIGCAELLAELFASTHYLPLLYLKPQGEQLVANLLKLVDLARDLEAEGVTTLTAFVRVLSTLQSLEIETEESPVNEPGDDVVRLLTIHKAKGLEFPVVILADGGLDVDAMVSPLVVDRVGGEVAFRLGGAALGLETGNWAAVRMREERRIRAEEMRLLYVAATRAEDYLIVPRHPAEKRGTFLGALAAADDGVFDTTSLDIAQRPLRPFRVDLRRLESGPHAQDAPRVWEEIVAARRRASRPPVFSVSTIQRMGAECPSPAFGNGVAGGAALGTVVHQALRRADFSQADEAARIADSVARAAALAEEQRVLAVRLVESAMALPSVRRAAAASASYREMPFAVKWEETIVEGAVDLAFVEDDALVIVDFKSDAVEAGAPLAAKLAAYRPQAVLYAFGLQRTTGIPVKEVWLSFLRPGLEQCIRADWEAEAVALLEQVARG